MKREIRDRRRELLKKSIRMKAILTSIEADNNFTLMDEQNDVFKKFKFYDGLIKAMGGDNNEKFNGRRIK